MLVSDKRTADAAVRAATNRLKDRHAAEYLAYLNEERRARGMLPLPKVNKWARGGGNPATRCPVRGHPMDCLCDFKRARAT